MIIRKIDTADNPVEESASWDGFEEGKPNPKSLPVDYQLEGELMRELSENRPMIVHRISRNGTKREGIMRTSPVQSIREKEVDVKSKESVKREVIVETQNSVYQLIEESSS